MLRRLTCLLTPLRGYKDDLTVKWVRPPYMPAYHPKRSGDLEPAMPVASEAVAKRFQGAEEFKDAPESVKQLLSVSYIGKGSTKMLIQQELLKRVQRHPYDENSAEAKIAKLTASIRHIQDHMEKFPRDVGSKVAVQEMIDRRKKLLKYLRMYDYKKFEWLLLNLNIEYKGHPNSHHKLSRKQSLKRLTKMYCDEVKNKKLDDYRYLLESQQGPFLETKLEDLKTIRSEQEALKLPITVTMQDIKKVEQALEKWKIKDEVKQASVKKKKKKTVVEV